MNGSFFSVVGWNVQLGLVCLPAAFKVVVFYLLLGCSPVVLGQNVECPALGEIVEKVEFSPPYCKEISLQDYRMSDQAVWLQISTEIKADQLQDDRPLGLFISGNMSARVYLNGHYIGRKGVPSVDKEKEIAGPFDWYVFTQRSILREGKNILVLFASSHHSSISNPGYFNRLYIGDYASTTDNYNKHYGMTYVPLGAMLIALAYLLSKGFNRSSKRLIALVTIAIVQLLVEVSRGFYSYPYYLHEVRLYTIAICSFLFGQCLLFYVLRHTDRLTLQITLLFSSVVTLSAQAFIENFDFRAIIAIQIPAVIALLMLIAKKLKLTHLPAHTNSKTLFIVLGSLLAISVVNQNDFLDSYFYFFVATILLAFTVNESNYKLALEQSLSRKNEQAEKLKQALVLSSEKEIKRTLEVKSAGRTVFLSQADIMFCKAAGDYVELVCQERSLLYSGSLQQLSQELASSFLRVHRSYIVNVKCITEIKRRHSGNGELTLVGGSKVPVSRTLFTEIRAIILTLQRTEDVLNAQINSRE